MLSPDGEWLLLVQAQDSTERDSDTGHMYLVRIDTGVVTPVPDATPMTRAQGEASVADTVLAWAPGGGAFACVCDGKLSVFDVQPTAPRVVLTSASPQRVTDVAWGGDGLVVRRLNGEWLSVSVPSMSVRPWGTLTRSRYR